MRILYPQKATDAVTRVIVRTTDIEKAREWRTIGVADNILQASYQALCDSMNYKLLFS